MTNNTRTTNEDVYISEESKQICLPSILVYREGMQMVKEKDGKRIRPGTMGKILRAEGMLDKDLAILMELKESRYVTRYILSNLMRLHDQEIQRSNYKKVLARLYKMGVVDRYWIENKGKRVSKPEQVIPYIYSLPEQARQFLYEMDQRGRIKENIELGRKAEVHDMLSTVIVNQCYYKMKTDYRGELTRAYRFFVVRDGLKKITLPLVSTTIKNQVMKSYICLPVRSAMDLKDAVGTKCAACQKYMKRKDARFEHAIYILVCENSEHAFLVEKGIRKMEDMKHVPYYFTTDYMIFHGKILENLFRIVPNGDNFEIIRDRGDSH